MGMLTWSHAKLFRVPPLARGIRYQPSDCFLNALSHCEVDM